MNPTLKAVVASFLTATADALCDGSDPAFVAAILCDAADALRDMKRYLQDHPNIAQDIARAHPYLED